MPSDDSLLALVGGWIAAQRGSAVARVMSASRNLKKGWQTLCQRSLILAFALSF
jgi:hypothetical protein